MRSLLHFEAIPEPKVALKWQNVARSYRQEDKKWKSTNILVGTNHKVT